MKISKSNLKQLKASTKYKGQSISAFFMYRRAWKAHLINIVTFSTLTYLAYSFVSKQHAIFVIGVLFGLLVRDFAWHRTLSKFWPVSDAVTNWEKVDEIINENET